MIEQNRYDDIIKAAVANHLPANYDWRLFKAQLWQESRLDPLAKSPAGATGVGQFMAGTWAQWASKAGFAGKKRTNPAASIITAAVYMKWLISQWRAPRPDADRYLLAMASYNAGIGHILDAQELADDSSVYSEIMRELVKVTGAANARETNNYGQRILAHYAKFLTKGRI